MTATAAASAAAERAADNARAALLMVVSMAVFAIEDLFLKRAAMALPPGQVIMITAAAGAALFWIIAARRGEPILSRDALGRPALVRSLSEALASMAYVPALALLPLSVNAALLQASPLVVTLGAALFLGERVGWRRWLAILVGFAGVLIILRPWQAWDFRLPGLLMVACVVIVAARDLVTRAMPARIGTFQLMTWAYLALIPAGALLMLLAGDRPQAIAPGRWLDLGLALISGMGGYWAVTAAMRLGEVSSVAPFRYSRLVFAAALAMIVLGERPDGWTLLGAALVIGSGLFIWAREAMLRRRKATARR